MHDIQSGFDSYSAPYLVQIDQTGIFVHHLPLSVSEEPDHIATSATVRELNLGSEIRNFHARKNELTGSLKLSIIHSKSRMILANSCLGFSNV